ncbi:MAG: class I SAM-dependent methyltransferase [Myxococcales bacterium]|nr:class I SAM-dependent methyltransferase [Myxococcales bacterium]
MEQDHHARWEQHYADDNLPWDSSEPAPALVARLPGLELRAGARVVEVGAGTGTNALYLARQGLQVTALDLSPTAVARARARAEAEGLAVDARVADWLAELPVAAGSQAFLFDRGCFHVCDAAGRARFAEQAAAALEARGWWLSLVGNADEESVGGGPPRVSLAELAAAVEPWFEIESVIASRFQGEAEALAWAGLYRKRRPVRPTFSHGRSARSPGA